MQLTRVPVLLYSSDWIGTANFDCCSKFDSWNLEESIHTANVSRVETMQAVVGRARNQYKLIRHGT